MVNHILQLLFSAQLSEELIAPPSNKTERVLTELKLGPLGASTKIGYKPNQAEAYLLGFDAENYIQGFTLNSGFHYRNLSLGKHYWECGVGWLEMGLNYPERLRKGPYASVSFGRYFGEDFHFGVEWTTLRLWYDLQDAQIGFLPSAPKFSFSVEF